MKLTSLLFRNGRRPQNPDKTPFKAVAPLVLKDYVTKNHKVTERGCLYETSLFLSCLEENEFEDKNCVPQMNLLDACYKKYNHDMIEKKIKSRSKALVPNSKNHTSNQISHLLRKYPTI
ncbi:coiled-coil-helix-coiled-coil-helix domain-containing protein 1 [Harpegnathos saltator]|uniref:Coiled-coil-helix-coiled-coil-helix domain-containing protein 1 n=1 Tax=Harpegnathos saltator TaxID=610380 RepID=E2BBP2_HARSA|nr:coiled-coil-helix-coiled-coil-helix domain-containing protein 1 [Harpegnathos saltator]XP_025155536.1 coiled-coil-helix-coiled-coil-helix domain-containing protein 1 [Harpegnathos saltator]XP_025155537.1 coiled-coil-helix-coiled-coil-helix domain-containing protein 1 [Harpegnathos saltator]EFN86919.1 hypothetical protein EAI_11979 [Harpegnathos saltator]